MGDDSDQQHILAEDVKLSAHGRHPTTYPFISCYFYFCFISFRFVFKYYFKCCVFKDKVYLHIGENVQFKFGGMETHLYTLCPVFEKKKKFACSCLS